MESSVKKIINLIIIVLLIGVNLEAKIDLSLKKDEIEPVVRKGLKWLEQQQMEDGSWNKYPAITGLSVLSFLRSYPRVVRSDYDAVRKGLDYIVKCVKKDGSIHAGQLPNYNTAICLLALKEANPLKYKDIIEKGERYLIGNQLSEEHGLTPDSANYGGMGFDGSDNQPDMSNLQWTAESLTFCKKAIVEIEEKQKEDPNAKSKEKFLERTIVFLSRCQNLKEYNPESYSGNDGGFIYGIGKSKLGDTRSYGTMTYAGLKSMIYAKLKKGDPRVAAAYNWLIRNYRVDQTPKMGKQGLYYYRLTMARTLSVYGGDTFTDTKGVSHLWREELANEIIKVQNYKGWWQNDNGRWWENDKVLATAYAILTLEELCDNNLE